MTKWDNLSAYQAERPYAAWTEGEADFQFASPTVNGIKQRLDTLDSPKFAWLILLALLVIVIVLIPRKPIMSQIRDKQVPDSRITEQVVIEDVPSQSSVMEAIPAKPPTNSAPAHLLPFMYEVPNL